MDEVRGSEATDLQQRLQEAEKNAIMAATYGKQLLDENNKLHTRLEETVREYTTKLEELEQEKHEISLKLEANLQMERSLALEMEQVREQQDQHIRTLISQATQSHEKQLLKHAKKVSELEAIIDSQRMELSQGKESLSLMCAQLKEAKEKLDLCNTSVHEMSADETSIMQSQLMSLTCEKQELEMRVTSLNSEIKVAKHQLASAQKSAANLEAELEEKECQCTSYFNALEKNKEEMVELRMEIESLRLAETDPARKGNSLFAEVEDQRQVMEQQLLNYKTNYNVVKKQCDLKSQQITKLKLQLASLLSLSSNKADTEYLQHLEESVTSARSQLEKFSQRCQELEAQLATATSTPKVEMVSDGQEVNNLFKAMYTESQKTVTELNQELQTARFDKVVLSDRILQLQRKLRQTESARDSTSAEVIRMRVRLEELAAKKGEKIGPDTKEVKRVVEKIPDFEKMRSPVNTPPELAEKEEEEKEAVPLKEKLLDPNTMQEIDRPTKHKSSEDESSGDTGHEGSRTRDNDENKLPTTHGLKKKPKKCVRMTETVAVQECDGQVQETQIKTEDGVKKLEKKYKKLRKMEAPVVKIPSGSPADECKQQ